MESGIYVCHKCVIGNKWDEQELLEWIQEILKTIFQPRYCN